MLVAREGLTWSRIEGAVLEERPTSLCHALLSHGDVSHTVKVQITQAMSSQERKLVDASPPMVVLRWGPYEFEVVRVNAGNGVDAGPRVGHLASIIFYIEPELLHVVAVERLVAQAEPPRGALLAGGRDMVERDNVGRPCSP